MPATSPPPSEQGQAQLVALGQRIRTRRKALKVSATAAAEAASISRVTLHRIEKGEASVTAGAWVNALAALGLEWDAREKGPPSQAPSSIDRTSWIPVRIRLDDHPQLKSLAWQVHGTDALTPVEAHDIYERNARHLDLTAMTAPERALWQALRTAFGSSGPG